MHQTQPTNIGVMQDCAQDNRGKKDHKQVFFPRIDSNIFNNFDLRLLM